MSSINLSSSTISLSRSRLNQSSTTLLHCVSLPSLFGIKTTGKVKATVISRQDDLLSYTNGNGSVINNRDQDSDSVNIGSLAADTVSAAPNGFVVEDDDYELDLPTPGFSSIPEAIQDIRQGKVCVLTCDQSFSVFFLFLCSDRIHGP